MSAIVEFMGWIYKFEKKSWNNNPPVAHLARAIASSHQQCFYWLNANTLLHARGDYNRDLRINHHLYPGLTCQKFQSQFVRKG